MDREVELQVLNISSSQAQVGAYMVVSGEIDGEQQLPIIMGPIEAQVAVICPKGIKTPRPLTYDLFYPCLNVLGAPLLRALIYKAKEGVFYLYIYLKRDEEIIRIDARTSDAVVLAVRVDCLISTHESILEHECIQMTDGTRHPDPPEEDDNSRMEAVSIIFLEETLSKAIQEEDYKLVTRPHDEVSRHK